MRRLEFLFVNQRNHGDAGNVTLAGENKRMVRSRVLSEPGLGQCGVLRCQTHQRVDEKQIRQVFGLGAASNQQVSNIMVGIANHDGNLGKVITLGERIEHCPKQGAKIVGLQKCQFPFLGFVQNGLVPGYFRMQLSKLLAKPLQFPRLVFPLSHKD